MTSPNAAVEVDHRMPVWVALSELFLDTELQGQDYYRIARALASSPYSEEKLNEILRFEVTPVLKWNLMCMAGEWAGFNKEWLCEKLVPRIDKRPFFRRGVPWMLRGSWTDIQSLVAEIRAKAVSEKL